MVKFWCPWCGQTASSELKDDLVPCLRCIREFTLLLGFVPITWMQPLEPGEEPEEPAAARKRFVFRDARTGKMIGRTARPVRDDVQPRAG